MELKTQEQVNRQGDSADMWHSSRGDRTLYGAEARLVASAMDTMMDALMLYLDDEDDLMEPRIPDCDSGISVYDRLNACQRIGLLHQIATYLLTKTTRPMRLSANTEAGVAAIFVEIRDQIAIELGLYGQLTADESHYWRRMVKDVLLEQLSEDELVALDLSSQCRELSAWEDAVDILCSAILWDRDFEMVDSFLDEDPGISDHRRRLLGIDQDYFTEIPPDPRPELAQQLVRETRELLRSQPS